MPRLNVEATNELKAWEAHNGYLNEHYKDRSMNIGWSQDGFSISSKIYGKEPIVVSTSLEPPYRTSEEPY